MTIPPTVSPESRSRASSWRTRLCCYAGLALGGTLGTSCKSAEDQTCLAERASAQAVVSQVKAEELASVESSVSALDRALGACRAAGKNSEVEELTKAHAQLVAHEERLVRRAAMLRARTELSPEELEQLEKSGDPKCPRGQAYVHGKAGPRIVCVGPQPIDMALPEALRYFKGRGYKSLSSGLPTELRFEYGAERIEFRYDAESGALPPRCVVVYPPPEMAWQEAMARLTGVSPARLKSGGSISTKAGSQRLAVEESQAKVVARVGDCAG